MNLVKEIKRFKLKVLIVFLALIVSFLGISLIAENAGVYRVFVTPAIVLIVIDNYETKSIIMKAKNHQQLGSLMKKFPWRKSTIRKRGDALDFDKESMSPKSLCSAVWCTSQKERSIFLGGLNNKLSGDCEVIDFSEMFIPNNLADYEMENLNSNVEDYLKRADFFQLVEALAPEKATYPQGKMVEEIVHRERDNGFTAKEWKQLIFQLKKVISINWTNEKRLAVRAMRDSLIEAMASRVGEETVNNFTVYQKLILNEWLIGDTYWLDPSD
ncbi:MAG: hypothetical protein PF542_05490 [Nanoarchaeota archaeon]|nr:hypothetical protein [Nanoarchaeota archaeon]